MKVKRGLLQLFGIMILVGAFGVPARGGIAVDSSVVNDAASASTSVVSPGVSTSAVNELLLAFIDTDYSSGSNTTVTSVTGAGLSWTLVKRANVQSGTAEIWKAFAAARISNQSVTATISQNVVSSITVVSLTGTDATGTGGAGAIGATAVASGSSGAPSVALTTTRAGSMVFATGNDYDNAISRTLGSGQTMLHQDLAPVGDTYWTQYLTSAVSSSGIKITINDTAPTSDRYNFAAVEVLPPGTSSPTFSISGSAGVAGAHVALSGAASASATASSTGAYSFSGLANGSYIVTPSLSGYGFTPTQTSVTVSGASVSAINFQASAVQPTVHSISGAIAPASLGAGAVLTLSGAANATVTADAQGNFSFSSVASGSYTVTPSGSGLSFSPTSFGVTVSQSNVSGVNFTASSLGGKVVFFDDFNGSTLGAQWTAMNRHGDYSNSENQCYLPGNVSVLNGLMTITSLNQTATCGDSNHSPSQSNYTSAMIQWTSFNFRYGTISARAKYPGGRGSWTAIWLLGSNCQTTNVASADSSGNCQWPYDGSREMDLFEANNNQSELDLNVFTSSGTQSTCNYPNNFDPTVWHTYTWVWGPGTLTAAVDGVDIGCSFNSTSQVSSDSMFLMINNAIGGSGGGTNVPGDFAYPGQKFQVDFVKVTQ